ncbi:Menaquinone via futalosine polyprenyltransferase (MenA homolog) [hydrothermal vent metagenome]|uniref:Menaquinone via futalosine polyprenyltransferase (MenA homolog) n=1 Tax=hydrothermal vent metagenome TaxID=652676 RepID=A0A3B1DFJ6_9ZZZZ
MTHTLSPQPPQNPIPAQGILAVVRAVASDIKLAHSVFALPFALLAAFLARPETDTPARFAVKLLLVIVCMVFARTWAMLINRLADRKIDAANPRTTGRPLASGRLTTRQGIAAACLSAAAFLAAASLFGFLFANWWPALLAAPVLAWIAFYSFTKRFTALCHLFLGGALAASPLCAAIAIDPASLAAIPALWWLAGMVLCWVAGFDVIYALQDLAFDRRAGLSSIPAALGQRGAAWVSRGLHLAASGCLVLAWLADPRLGMFFAVGIAATIVLLIAEHIVLSRKGLAGLSMAFFTLNGIVSCVLGAAGITDLLWLTSA